MTVKAWFTISAIVLAALVAAVAFQIFRPVSPPQILVRAGDVRLEGAPVRSCWPQRSGTRCSSSRPADTTVRTIPGSGSFRIVVAYPAQPPAGTIRITSPGRGTVVNKRWTSSVRYELDPGRYLLVARAENSRDVYVTYNFRFTVTRSGS